VERLSASLRAAFSPDSSGPNLTSACNAACVIHRLCRLCLAIRSSPRISSARPSRPARADAADVSSDAATIGCACGFCCTGGSHPDCAAWKYRCASKSSPYAVFSRSARDKPVPKSVTCRL
jgi:hypothetical protein